MCEAIILLACCNFFLHEIFLLAAAQEQMRKTSNLEKRQRAFKKVLT